jgi:hypothetical protein
MGPEEEGGVLLTTLKGYRDGTHPLDEDPLVGVVADLASLLVMDPLAQDHGLKLGISAGTMTEEGRFQSYIFDPSWVLGKDDKGGGVGMPVPNDDVAGWIDKFTLLDLRQRKQSRLVVQVGSPSFGNKDINYSMCPI